MSIEEVLNEIPNKKIEKLNKGQLILLVEKCILELKNTEEKNITQYKDCQNKIQQINDFNLEEKNQALLEKIKTLKTNIDQIHEKTQEAEKKIIGTNEGEGWKDKIELFHNKLFEETKNGDSYKKQINSFFEKIKKESKEIENIKNRLEDIKVKERDEEGNEIIDDKTGKPHYEVREGLLTNIKNFYTEKRNQYTELFEKVESLLPGATSAGLASAYEENVKEYKTSVKIWTRASIGCLILILVFSGFNFFQLSKETEWIKILNSIVKSLPSSGILIWLAYFCTKRRSENKRLQEEYQHKLSVAKTYEGYKKEIKNLSAEGNSQLIEKLLNTMIKATDFNPSVTLEKKHGDKMPLQEAMEKQIKKE